MGNLNQVHLIGHTGSEIQMHYFEGGGCIGRITLATNDSYKNKNTGEKVETTEWHNLVFRNKPAEIIEKWVSKGDKIRVSGKLTYSDYEKDGQKIRSANIDVNDFEFLKTRKSSNTTVNQPETVTSKDDDNDLPF
jgi:single-strand DNA-binding protein